MVDSRYNAEFDPAPDASTTRPDCLRYLHCMLRSQLSQYALLEGLWLTDQDAH